ncbi:MAG: AmmeMemoRadiSam system protein A [Betaproteobacteria bacterium]|nr:AmmeMemoRadiSam system protein A [Betaproteobacteria bacterium]
MSSDLGNTLLLLARQAIADRLAVSHAHAPVPDLSATPELMQPGAAFVTLTHHGELRGCIGSLEAWRPLTEDVVANACAAAFSDPRFAPLTVEELAGIRVEVSLLTAAQSINFTSEADAIQQLRPGVDGVILEHAQQRGTFLPQVWESLPEARQFLRELKRKAGLPADFWSDQVKLSRYQVQKWREAP